MHYTLHIFDGTVKPRGRMLLADGLVCPARPLASPFEREDVLPSNRNDVSRLIKIQHSRKNRDNLQQQIRHRIRARASEAREGGKGGPGEGRAADVREAPLVPRRA